MGNNVETMKIPSTLSLRDDGTTCSTKTPMSESEFSTPYNVDNNINEIGSTFLMTQTSLRSISRLSLNENNNEMDDAKTNQTNDIDSNYSNENKPKQRYIIRNGVTGKFISTKICEIAAEFWQNNIVDLAMSEQLVKFRNN